MSNRWGRNTQLTQGGSSAGFVLAALLCLLLIGAGVYGWFVRQNLQAEIAGLNTANAKLADKLAKAETDRTKLAADIEALKRNAGQWAGELEQDYANLQLNEVPKLNRLLDKRDATITDLERQLDALKADGATNVQEKARLASDLQTARGAARRDAEIIADLRAKVDTLASEAERLRAESGQLGDARARAQSLLVAAQARAEAAEKKLETLQKERIPGLEREIATQRARVAALELRLATPDAKEETRPQPMQAEPAKQPTTDGTGRPPRDGAQIAALLDSQPGLNALDDQRRRQLQDELSSGACVTDALDRVFDRVPLIVMRNLMRELKSDC
jgi:chromosome segregation ATPase